MDIPMAGSWTNSEPSGLTTHHGIAALDFVTPMERPLMHYDYIYFLIFIYIHLNVCLCSFYMYLNAHVFFVRYNGVHYDTWDDFRDEYLQTHGWRRINGEWRWSSSWCLTDIGHPGE